MMKKMEKIYRNFNVELRSEENTRTVRGYAVIFDSWSRDLGGFQELIRSGSINQDLLNHSNVIMNTNHNNEQMLARWIEGNGTLKLSLDDKGLAFEFESPQTERGNELLWNIRNGNLYECSFCFSLPNNKTCERWYRDEAGNLKREINEIGGLYDCSIVNTAAYPATSVANRENIDIEAIIRSLDEEDEQKRKAEEAIKQQEIIDNLDNKLKDFLEKVNI